MSEPEQVYKDLKKVGLVTEVFDQALNKKVIMLTPKGAEWYTFLAEVYGDPPKKTKAKIRLRAPKKETVNKIINKVIDGMEAVAKFGQQIDDMTGGKPKNPADLFSSPAKRGASKGKRHGKKSKTKRRRMGNSR